MVKRDTSSVFNVETLDEAHKRQFDAKLPWIFEHETRDGYDLHCCVTEEEARALQRAFRKAHGFDPMTGEAK